MAQRRREMVYLKFAIMVFWCICFFTSRTNCGEDIHLQLFISFFLTTQFSKHFRAINIKLFSLQVRLVMPLQFSSISVSYYLKLDFIHVGCGNRELRSI
jgi:hypothetical protein